MIEFENIVKTLRIYNQSFILKLVENDFDFNI